MSVQPQPVSPKATSTEAIVTAERKSSKASRNPTDHSQIATGWAVPEMGDVEADSSDSHNDDNVTISILDSSVESPPVSNRRVSAGSITNDTKTTGGGSTKASGSLGKEYFYDGFVPYYERKHPVKRIVGDLARADCEDRIASDQSSIVGLIEGAPKNKD